MRGNLRRWLALAAVCVGGLIYLLVAGISGAGNAAARGGRSAATHVHGAAAPSTHNGSRGGGAAASARLQHAWSVDARKGMIEMLGTADGSRVGWNRHFAEWGGLNGPHWWQSALAMLTALHYAMQTGYRSAMLDHVIRVTYDKNIWKPKSLEKFDFINQYMDDTV